MSGEPQTLIVQEIARHQSRLRAFVRWMATVRKHGQEDNTLVMFYSDNGGPTAESSSRNDPLRGFQGQMFEGGIRVPFVMQCGTGFQPVINSAENSTGRMPVPLDRLPVCR